MNISIVDQATGYMTTYTPADLRRLAQSAVKGRGKLSGYWVTFRGSCAVLNAQYVMRDGWSQTAEKPLILNVAI